MEERGQRNLVGCGIRKNLENGWVICAVDKGSPVSITGGASCVWKVCEIGVSV